MTNREWAKQALGLAGMMEKLFADERLDVFERLFAEHTLEVTEYVLKRTSLDHIMDLVARPRSAE